MDAQLPSAIAAAERILARRFGDGLRLELGDQGGLNQRDHVHRLALVQGPEEAPSNVILKRARLGETQAFDPKAVDGPAASFFDEWAGLHFLNQVCRRPLPGPEFYGGDQGAGLILMEDYGAGTRLDHALLGEDAALAQKTLIALFETVGRLHAQTAGKQAQYDQLRRSIGPTPERDKIDKGYLEHIRHNLEAIGLKAQRDFYKDCEQLIKMLDAPGPFNAYVHFDPCPDNCHWVGSELRLLDFEKSRYGHALIDGVYARIHFPTCWCVGRIPDAIARDVEDAYRAALAKGCPQAADDRIFDPALVGACAFWALVNMVNSMPAILEEEDQADKTTARQRLLLRLEIAARTAEEFGHFKAIGGTLYQTAAQLRTRWSDPGELPYYPAFQNHNRPLNN